MPLNPQCMRFHASEAPFHGGARALEIWRVRNESQGRHSTLHRVQVGRKRTGLKGAVHAHRSPPHQACSLAHSGARGPICAAGLCSRPQDPGQSSPLSLEISITQLQSFHIGDHRSAVLLRRMIWWYPVGHAAQGILSVVQQ